MVGIDWKQEKNRIYFKAKVEWGSISNLIIFKELV